MWTKNFLSIRKIHAFNRRGGILPPACFIKCITYERKNFLSTRKIFAFVVRAIINRPRVTLIKSYIPLIALYIPSAKPQKYIYETINIINNLKRTACCHGHNRDGRQDVRPYGRDKNLRVSLITHCFIPLMNMLFYRHHLRQQTCCWPKLCR